MRVDAVVGRGVAVAVAVRPMGVFVGTNRVPVAVAAAGIVVGVRTMTGAVPTGVPGPRLVGVCAGRRGLLPCTVEVGLFSGCAITTRVLDAPGPDDDTGAVAAVATEAEGTPVGGPACLCAGVLASATVGP